MGITYSPGSTKPFLVAKKHSDMLLFEALLKESRHLLFDSNSVKPSQFYGTLLLNKHFHTHYHPI